MLPFKKGDWLVVTIHSKSYIHENHHIHQAKEDPKPNKEMGSGFSYRANTVYSFGINSLLDSAHFRKATKEDLRKEAEKLTQKGHALLRQAGDLLDAADHM